MQDEEGSTLSCKACMHTALPNALKGTGLTSMVSRIIFVCILGTTIINLIFFGRDGGRVVLQDDALLTSTLPNSTVLLGYQKQQARVHDQQQQAASSKYAYAYLLAGCNPDKASYHGFLFNILISAHILQISGSEADFIVFVRMASDTKHKQLPDTEMEWLKRLQCRVIYLPKVEMGTENFDESQMLKFNILDLIEYRRVLYLDSDNMPVCNLDYIFDLSDNSDPILKENLVVAWNKEPSNGGFFMLKPGKGEHNELRAIIEEKQRDDFDEIKGWGHEIIRPDSWKVIKGKQGRKWDFYAAHTDQGLLYHWVKYVKKNVSIVVSMYELQNWGVDSNGTLVMENKTVGLPLYNYSCLPKNASNLQLGFASHPAYGLNLRKHVPLGNIVHFYKRFKPWEGNVTVDITSKEQAVSATQYWFHVLRELNELLHMGIEFDNWSEYAAPFRMAPYGDGFVASVYELKQSAMSRKV
jgi:hypothetical protein